MQTQKRQLRHRARIIAMYVVLAVSAILLLWLWNTIKAPDTRFDDQNIAELTGDWTIEYDGKIISSPLPADIGKRAVTPVRYSIQLQESYGIYINSMMIRSVHQYYRVYLDGVLLDEYGFDNSTPFGSRPYNAWFVVRLPDDWQGKLLTIEETRYYEEHSGNLCHVYLGSKNSLVLNRVGQSFFFLVMDTCVLVGSLIMIVVSFVYRKKEPVIQLRYLGVFAFVTGLWMMLESTSYQIFFHNGPFISNLIFILFSMVPFTAAGFILTYESFWGDKWMKAMFWLGAVNFGLVHVLQIMGISDYIRSIAGSHLLLLGIAADIVWKAVQARRKREVLKDKPLYVSCLVLTVFALMDIVRFYVGDPQKNASYFTQIGLFLFFLTLLGYGIQRIFKDYESGVREEVLAHMAYTDVMTGLPNRNAYERELDRLRAKRPDRLVMVVADLNGLKVINDRYGHKRGDEALTAVAAALSQTLDKRAMVYRIGGDEFCVISSCMTAEEMGTALADVDHRLKTESAARGIPIWLAAGCSSLADCGMQVYGDKDTGAEVDEILKKADILMYRKKKEMKRLLKEQKTGRRDLQHETDE